MANTFKIKRSAVQGKVPAVGDLQLGELAVNTYDGRLFTKKDAGGTISIVEIGASSSTTTFTSDISLQNQSATRYYEASANGTNYIAIKAPSSLAADVTLILPPNDGDPDQVLGTDGNGTLSWVSRISGSGTSGDFLSASTSSEQSGYFGNIYLKDDANTSHYLEITNSDDLTASRTLSVDVNDANRSITLSGNISLANSFTTSGNFGLTLTTTGLTDVTLPTSGTLAVNNQTMHIGTTAVAINRASGSLALTGITSIDGSAATLSTTRTLWGQNFNGSANVTGSLTSVGNITGTGAVTLTATSGALNLTATGANEVAVNTNGVQRVSVASNGLSTFGSQAASGSALTVTAPAKLYTGTGTYTDSTTAASGTATHGAIVAFDNPSIAATNTSVTYTNASTVYIDGAPTAGTNVTLTNAYSLYVNTGVSLFGGSVRITGLTASQAVFTDANDNLVSNAITGSGNVVMSASPTLTGTPISTTAAVDTNTTQIATTEFVVGQASATNPLALGTAAVGTSLRYSRQDHVHPTTGLGLTSGTLAQFAATTSAQLAGVISDETGSGVLVFGTSPSFTTSVTTGSASFNVFNTTATTINAFGASTALTLGATSGTTTIRNNVSITGNLTVNGTTTTVNSTTLTIDDPIITLGGDTSVAEVTKDRGVEFKWNGTALTITNYIGNGTTTVTGTVASTSGYAVGDIITISGATGTEQTKLNGTWAIASVPTGTTFTFVVTSTVTAGTYTTTLGTTVKSKSGFFGLDQSTGRFTFIPQSSQSGEVYSGTVGDIDVRNGFFSGNVGVGTTNPFSGTANSGLDVNYGGAIIQARNVGNTSPSSVWAADQDYFSTPSYKGTGILKYGTSTAGTLFGSIPYADAGTLAFQNTAIGVIYTNGGSPLVLGTLSTEALRIDTSQNVGIGTTSPSGRLEVTGGWTYTESIWVKSTNSLYLNSGNFSLGPGGSGMLMQVAGAPNNNFTISSNDFIVTGYGGAGERLRITNSGEIRILEDVNNGTNYVGFKAPTSLTANTVWTLPSADGTNGQALVTNGSGVLSWAAAGGGGGVDAIEVMLFG
jgi:hypothetical protein